jgi:hypothetical protein
MSVLIAQCSNFKIHIIDYKSGVSFQVTKISHVRILDLFFLFCRYIKLCAITFTFLFVVSIVALDDAGCLKVNILGEDRGGEGRRPEGTG